MKRPHLLPSKEWARHNLHAMSAEETETKNEEKREKKKKGASDCTPVPKYGDDKEMEF